MAYKPYNDIYRSYHKKHQQKIRASITSCMLTEIKETEKAKDPYNKFILESGMKWYNDGHSIDEADESIKNNSNFIRGFELAMRQDYIRKDLESQGAQWYYACKSLEEASPRMQNCVSFVKGFNDAKNGENLLVEEVAKPLVKSLK
jgi:hypothetical protein